MEHGVRLLGWSHLGMVLFLGIVFILLKKKEKKILNFGRVLAFENRNLLLRTEKPVSS